MISNLRRMADALGAPAGEVERWSMIYRRLWPRRGWRAHSRTPLFHPDMPFVLSTSQKAGSTVAVRWYFHQAGVLETAVAHGSFVHHYEQEVFIQRPGYAREVSRAMASAPVVKIVREPAARAFSSYVTVNQRPAFGEPSSPTYWMRRLILRETGGGPADQPLSFRRYLTWLADVDHARIDGHHARQTNAWDARIGDRLEVVQVERFAAELNALERRWGLPETPQADQSGLLSSEHHFPKRDHAPPLAQLVEEGAAAPGLTMQPAADKAALAAFEGVGPLLLRAFAKDYARFGYPSPLEA